MMRNNFAKALAIVFLAFAANAQAENSASNLNANTANNVVNATNAVWPYPPVPWCPPFMPRQFCPK
jgi:hypothetical protein